MLPVRRLIAFSLPAIPMALLLIPVTAVLPTFYATAIGLDLKVVGGIFFLARLWDVIVDPFIGAMSDRTRSRWGRRRPWIVAGGVVTIVAAAFVFFPPATVTPWFLVLALMGLYLGWTMVMVPHYSWAAELEGDYHGRTRVAGIRDAAYFVGIFLGAVLIGVMSRFGHDLDRVSTGAFGVATFVLVPLALLAAVRSVPDPQRADAHASVTELLDVVRRNPPFRRLLLLYSCGQLAAALSNSLAVLYVIRYLHAPKMVGPVVLVNYLALVLALPAWIRLSYRIGKHRAAAWSMSALVAVCVAIAFIPPGATVPFLLLAGLAGVALGGALSLPNAMTADVVDYDTLRTRKERAGLYFSLKLLVMKAASAVAIGVAFPLLDLLGFDAQAAPGSPMADRGLDALRYFYSLAPIPLLLVAIALVWRFPLDARRHGIIRRRLQRRTANGARRTGGTEEALSPPPTPQP